MLKAFVKVNVQIQLDDDDETPSELSVEQQVELDAKRAQLKYPISQHFNAVCYPATKEDANNVLKGLMSAIELKADEAHLLRWSGTGHVPTLEKAFGGCPEPKNGTENGAN